MSEPEEQFRREVRDNIAGLAADTAIQRASIDWINATARHKYTYNFRWLGRPVIQFPQDMFAMQELLWTVQPDLVIETGIAHGGSVIYYASLLELIAICGGPQDSRVLAVDIDIRAHNRVAIEAHPLSRRVTMVEGSSISPDVIAQVRRLAEGRQRVLVCLDSNHTHEHVLRELEAYAPLTSVGSYCVVFDTVVEDMPAETFPDRPWGPGNNPKTAVHEFLASHDGFRIDADIPAKLLITVAPDGYLQRVA